jgi:hypothetical protein
VSCGSTATTRKSERPLSAEEAAQLATVQKLNYDSAGAVVEVNTAFTTTGDTLSMQAQVDWQHHSGHGGVVAKGAEAGITEVYWTQTSVLELRPALNVVLQGRGYQGIDWVARPPDSAKRQLDRAIAVVVGLASKEPDNALLVQQQPGSAFVRTDTLRGTPVDLLRYGKRNTYWVDPKTGQMLRFEGNAEGLTAPIIVDILQRGAQTITFRLASAVVLATDIPQIYETVTRIPVDSLPAPSGS